MRKFWTLSIWEFLNIAISCLLLLAGVTWHPRLLRWQAIQLDEWIIFLWKLLPNPKKKDIRHIFLLGGTVGKKNLGNKTTSNHFEVKESIIIKGSNLDPTVSGSHHRSWHQCALTAFPRRMAATSRWCLTDDGYHDIYKGQPSWIWCGV